LDVSVLKSLACRLCPPGAKKIAKTRGLCHTCYRLKRVEVNAGKTTWKELAAQDLCHLTPGEMGLPKNVLFSRQYFPREIDLVEKKDK
jgi:hypothetical protein